MATGPGKYDDLCSVVRGIAEAEIAVVIITNGVLGSGFSVQGPAGTLQRLPDALEEIARQIRLDLPDVPKTAH